MSGMIEFLARAAKEAREDNRRKHIHIAVEVDIDPSTVYRFEQGRWPRDPDEMVDAYAVAIGVEPRQIWARALELWA